MLVTLGSQGVVAFIACTYESNRTIFFLFLMKTNRHRQRTWCFSFFYTDICCPLLFENLTKSPLNVISGDKI